MNYLGFALPLALPHGFVSGAALFANLARSEKGSERKVPAPSGRCEKIDFCFWQYLRS
jgi:hypothetical protein